jgi:hypothetical protein
MLVREIEHRSKLCSELSTQRRPEAFPAMLFNRRRIAFDGRLQSRIDPLACRQPESTRRRALGAGTFADRISVEGQSWWSVMLISR